MSLQSFVTQLPSYAETVRESALLMVQVVNSLKNLQAQGREEASLTQFVLSREEQQFSPRVFLLPHEASKVGPEESYICVVAKNRSQKE